MISFCEFHESINAPGDLLIYVLRFHLLTENMLERIINVSLPRGANLVRNARLSYAQKLAVVDALGILDEKLTERISQRLNSLRNSCAHKRKMKVTIKEIDPMANLSGKNYHRLSLILTKTQTKQNLTPQFWPLLFLVSYIDRN